MSHGVVRRYHYRGIFNVWLCDRNLQDDNNFTLGIIVTTHDSNIMNLDFVRQDEVWFIERQKDHSSKLYSLNKFMARFDKKVEKDYLLGRYGAIPIFRQVALEPGALEEGEQSAEGS